MPTDTRPIPPMPDLVDCPTWCERDHLADWQRHVTIGRDACGIPLADGTVFSGGFTEEEWHRQFEPMHTRTVAQFDGGGYVVVQLDGDRRVVAFEGGADVMTAQQVREVASGLLAAAAFAEEPHEH